MIRKSRITVDDDGYPIVDTVGSAEVGGDEPIDHPAAVLWIPAIDGQHKWREHRVEKPEPARRRLGFLP